MEKKLYRGGAPKKDEAERKERIVRVLFNQSEFDKLSERKLTTKCASLSDFIRTVCLDKPLRMKPQLTTHEEAVLSLIREMRSDVLRIGVNINQSSKRINSTTDYYDLQRDVHQMGTQFVQIDANLRLLMSVVLGTNQVQNLTLAANDGSPNQ